MVGIDRLLEKPVVDVVVSGLGLDGSLELDDSSCPCCTLVVASAALAELAVRRPAAGTAVRLSAAASSAA